MSPLLMIESWANAHGVILPQKRRALRHGDVLLARAPEHYARRSPPASAHMAMTLAEDVARVETCPGRRAGALPLDNEPGGRLS